MDDAGEAAVDGEGRGEAATPSGLLSALEVSGAAELSCLRMPVAIARHSATSSCARESEQGNVNMASGQATDITRGQAGFRYASNHSRAPRPPCAREVQDSAEFSSSTAVWPDPTANMRECSELMSVCEQSRGRFATSHSQLATEQVPSDSPNAPLFPPRQSRRAEPPTLSTTSAREWD